MGQCITCMRVCFLIYNFLSLFWRWGGSFLGAGHPSPNSAPQHNGRGNTGQCRAMYCVASLYPDTTVTKNIYSYYDISIMTVSSAASAASRATCRCAASLFLAPCPDAAVLFSVRPLSAPPARPARLCLTPFIRTPNSRSPSCSGPYKVLYLVSDVICMQTLSPVVRLNGLAKTRSL